MHPFQLQAEFVRQWLDFASSMTSSAVAATSMLSQQATSNWTRAMTGAAAPAINPWPGYVWPGVATPPAAPSFAFTNPFSVPVAPAAWPFAPWMSALTWMWPPQAPMGAVSPITAAWLWPWGAAWSMMPWMMPSRPSHPDDAMEHVASAYRTATGYAVAAVMGPFGAALDPRTYGEPWWQNYPKRGLLN
jgi:hypothetical protein